MIAAGGPVDVGYQEWWEIARGVRHLAGTLDLIQRSIAAKESVHTTARDRADAEHILAVQVPGLQHEAKRLARAAERLAALKLIAEVVKPHRQAANA